MRTAQLQNQTFGYLTVVERAGSQNNHAMWKCVCKCGKTVYANTGDLRSGKTKSCGCWRAENSKKNRIEEVGKTYNYLTVVSHVGTDAEGKALYLCKCKCGNMITTTGKRLRSGITQSCGCYNKEIVSKRSLHDLTGKRFGMLTVVSRADTRISEAGNQSTMWNCVCDCGNHCVVYASALITQDHTRSCGCMKMSFREKEIADILTANNIKFSYDYSVEDLVNPQTGNPLRFDFAFFDMQDNIIAFLEHQGEQHYKQYANHFGDLQREVTDDLKRKYCANNSIPLYEIKFDEDINTSIKVILDKIYNTSHDNSVPSASSDAKV